jgi:hypothetical protein
MHRLRTFALALLAILAASSASAQSDILLRLRSGSPLGDRFRVDSAGGVIGIGQLGIGIIPATGVGWRMMWYPFKAAFRAGGLESPGTQWNDASVGFYSWAGGHNTTASAFSTFAFGDAVTVSGTDAAGFGGSSTVSGTAGFSAGASNLCSGFGCVTMGFTNTATGQGSVAIGYRVTADADYAVALGHRASANGHSGTFVAADESTTDSVEASANNQFMTRYAGGYRLYTNATTTVGVSLNAGGSAWNVISDRRLKRDFLEVDGEQVLSRIRALPVQTWSYLSEGREIRHMGPMAQDWHAAWGFNSDDTTINSGDFDGVNLAAVKALEARTTALQEQLRLRDQRIAALEAHSAALQAQAEQRDQRSRDLEERLARVEAALAASAP